MIEQIQEQMPPKVSVIICAFNAEQYISRAVESVLCQTFPEFELIVVDDASTDSTRHEVRRWVDRDRRVSMISQPVNCGLAKTRMVGLLNARSDFVVFLDADDVALPTLLERQYSAISAHPEILGVASYAQYVGENEKEVIGLQKVGPVSRDDYFKIYEKNRLVFLPATTMCRRRDMLAVGGFRVGGFPSSDEVRLQDYCDDLDLWCRMSDLSKDGRYFITLPEPLFLYRKRAGSLSTRNVFAMQRKMRWVKDCLLRRRARQTERSFADYEASLSTLARIRYAQEDYGALFYKRAALSVMRGWYFRAALALAVVTVLNPRLLLQKLRTQSRAGRA